MLPGDLSITIFYSLSLQIRAAAEEESVRTGSEALSEEFCRLRSAQHLADYQLFYCLAVLLPGIYLGCLLWLEMYPDSSIHLLERLGSFFMHFLRWFILFNIVIISIRTPFERNVAALLSFVVGSATIWHAQTANPSTAER